MKYYITLLCIILFTGSIYAFDCDPTFFKPVCGNDGKTYTNECILQAQTRPEESLGVDYYGECSPLSTNICHTWYTGFYSCTVMGDELIECIQDTSLPKNDRPYCIAYRNESTQTIYEIPSSSQERVAIIRTNFREKVATKSFDYQQRIRETLIEKIIQKIEDMEEFKIRATFTPEGLAKYNQRIGVLQYFLSLVENSGINPR